VFVLEPEVERWIWCDPSRLLQEVRWPPEHGHVLEWLGQEAPACVKEGRVVRPKEALDAVLRAVGRPRSSSLFDTLGKTMSIHRCSDAEFRRMAAQLRAWFPGRSDAARNMADNQEV